MSPAQPARTDSLTVEARTHRRTALVALRGELDLVTVSKVAEVMDELARMPEVCATSCSTCGG